MNRPDQLSSDDYTAADLAEMRQALSVMTTDVSTLLKGCAPSGQWEPSDADPLAELAAADNLIEQMYRSLRMARQAISRCDRSARARFTDRTDPRSPVPHSPPG